MQCNTDENEITTNENEIVTNGEQNDKAMDKNRFLFYKLERQFQASRRMVWCNSKSEQANFEKHVA